MFTPELVATYEKLKNAGRNFEVVFVSADQSEEDFTNYFKMMPWLAVPFDDKFISQLTERFEVTRMRTFFYSFQINYFQSLSIYVC